MSTDHDFSNHKIAVLIPCYNECLTIGKVVREFKENLPNADIIVFDNNSTDGSVNNALEAGARIIKEKRQGKGFVVSSMLSKIDADYYVMIDGDDTYPANMVNSLLFPLINESADMVVGQRLSVYEDNAFRPLHVLGNRLIAALINLVFSTKLKDPMSGYRSFTREVAENLPIVASGFDVETEMTLQLLYRHYIISEIEIPYNARPLGSNSKLHTIRDGIKVLFKIFSIVKAYKPLTFFGSLSIISFIGSLIAGAIVLSNFIHSSVINNFLIAIIAATLLMASIMLLSIGLIITTLNFRLLEISNVISKQIRKEKYG